MEKVKPTSKSLGASKKSKNADHNTSRKSADAERNDNTSTDAAVRMLTPIVPEAVGPSTTPSTATEEERPPTRIHKNLNVHFTEKVTRIPASDTTRPYDLDSDDVVEGHSSRRKSRQNTVAHSGRDGKDVAVAKHPFRHDEMAKMLRISYQQHYADFAPSDEVLNAQKSQESIEFEDEVINKSVTNFQLEERKGELLESTVASDLYPPAGAAQTKDDPAGIIDNRVDIRIFTQNFGEDEDQHYSPPIFQTTIAAKKASLQNDPKQKLLLPPLPDIPPVAAGGAQKDVTASKMTNLLLAEVNKTGSSVKIATTPADEVSDPKANQKSAQPKAPAKGKPAPNPTGSNVRMSHKKDQPLSIVQEVIPVGESPPPATPVGPEKPQLQQVKGEPKPAKKFKSWDRLFDFRPEDLRIPLLTTGTGFGSVPGPIGMRNQFVEDQIDQRFFQQFFDELVNKWSLYTFGLADCDVNREALMCKLEAKPEVTVLDLLPLIKHTIQEKEIPPPATLFDGIAKRIESQLQQAYAVNFPKYDRGPLQTFPQSTSHICSDIPFEACNNLTGCSSPVLRPWGHYTEQSVSENQKKSAQAKTSVDPTVKIIRLLPHPCWPEELFPKDITKQVIRPRYLAPTKTWTTHIRAQKEMMRDIRKIRLRSKIYHEFVTFFGHPNARKPRPSCLAIFLKAHHRALRKLVKKPSYRFSNIQFRRIPKAVSCGKLQQPIASEPALDHKDDQHLPQMINQKNFPWKHVRDEALHAYRLASHPKERHFSKSHDNEPEENLSTKLSATPAELKHAVSAAPVIKEPSAVGFRHTPEGSIGDNVFSIVIPEKRTSGGRKRKGSMARSSPDIATNVKAKKGQLASGVSETLNREWDNSVMKTISASPNIAKYKLANIPPDFRWSLLKTSTGLDKLSEDTDEVKETGASGVDVPDRTGEMVPAPCGSSSDGELLLAKKAENGSLSRAEKHASTAGKLNKGHRNSKITEIGAVRPVVRTSGPETRNHVTDTIARKDSVKATKRRCYSLRNFVSGKGHEVVHPRLQRSVILHKNVKIVGSAEPTKVAFAFGRTKHPGSGDPQTRGKSSKNDDSVLNRNFWKNDKPFVAVLHPIIQKVPLKGFKRFLANMDTNSESEVCELFSVRSGCGLIVSPKTVADIEGEIRFHRTSAFVPNNLILRCLTKLTNTASGSGCANAESSQSIYTRMSKPVAELSNCENKALGLLFYLNRLRRHAHCRNLIRRFTGEYRYNHIQRLHMKKLAGNVPIHAEQEIKTSRPSTEKPAEPIETEPSGQRKRSTPKLISQREKSPDEKSLATTETEESIKSKKNPLKVEKKDRIKTAAGDPNKDRRAPMELGNKPTEVHSIGFVPGKAPVAAVVEPEKTDKGGNNLQTIRKNMIPVSFDDERSPWWKTWNPEWAGGAQRFEKDKAGIWNAIKSKLFTQIEQSPELLQVSVCQETQISNSDFPCDSLDVLRNHVSPHEMCESGKRADDVDFFPDRPAQTADKRAKISTIADSHLPMDYNSDERLLPALEQLQRRNAYYYHAKRYLLSLMPGSQRDVIEAKLRQLSLFPSEDVAGSSTTCSNDDNKLNCLVELIEELSLQGAMSESNTTEDMRDHLLVKLLRLELVNTHLEHVTHTTISQQLQSSNHDHLSQIASKLVNFKSVNKPFVPVTAEEEFIATPPASPVRHLSPLRPRQESAIVVAAEDSDSGKKTKNDKKSEKDKVPKKKADEVKKPPTTKGKKESMMQSSHVNLSSPTKKKPPKA